MRKECSHYIQSLKEYVNHQNPKTSTEPQNHGNETRKDIIKISMICSKLLSSGVIGKMKSQTILSAAMPQITTRIPPIAINIIGLS